MAGSPATCSNRRPDARLVSAEAPPGKRPSGPEPTGVPVRVGNEASPRRLDGTRGRTGRTRLVDSATQAVLIEDSDPATPPLDRAAVFVPAEQLVDAGAG